MEIPTSVLYRISQLREHLPGVSEGLHQVTGNGIVESLEYVSNSKCIAYLVTRQGTAKPIYMLTYNLQSGTAEIHDPDGGITKTVASLSAFTTELHISGFTKGISTRINNTVRTLQYLEVLPNSGKMG